MLKNKISSYFFNFYTIKEKYILLYSLFAGLITFFASAPFFIEPALLLGFGFLADILFKSVTVNYINCVGNVFIDYH